MMKFRCKTTPWEHQKKAVKFLFKIGNAGALYTDMGTGKTKVMIDLIQNRGFNRVLIVAPKKACEVWESEIYKHGITGVFSVVQLCNSSISECIEALEGIPKRSSKLKLEGTLTVIMNYDKVWRKGISNRLMRKTIGFDCVVCDESHRIKNPTSKCSSFLARLGAKTPYRYAVTGTPLAENPVDIYAQYKFLLPSIFGGNFWAFRDRYENPDVTMSTRIGHRVLDKTNPYKNQEELSEKMYSIAFRADSSVKLPKQTDIEWEVKIPKKTEVMYKEFIKEKVVEVGEEFMTVSNILTSSLRLQQITSGYITLEDLDGNKRIKSIDHAKAKELLELIELLPKGEPIVVFAVFKRDLDNIRTVCKKLGLLYSEVSGREDTQSEWKSGKTQVIGVQYSSGSESIDLTRARYCIYYSLTSRLALYTQSRKRIHRPNQTRSVYYYHLISKLSRGKSIDEKLFEALKSKKSIVDYIMEKGWD